MKRSYWLLIAGIACLVGGVLISGCERKEEHPHKHGEGCHCYCFQQKEDSPSLGEAQHHGHPGGHEHPNGHRREDEGAIKISSQARKIMGLKIDKVTLRHIKKSLRVTGELAQESEKLFHVTSNIPGEIIEVRARLGDQVRKGTLLALVKSNQDGKIEEIKAPSPSLIIGQHISEGEEVDRLTSLFTIADLSTMKASFDVHLKDIALVKVGQKVKVETRAFPGKIYSGKIVFISPRVDKRTRTIKIRVDIDNYDHTLKLGMFVTGYILYASPKKVISIPNSAIQIRDGEKIVFIPLKDDKYIAREIEVGLEGEYFSQILSGLKIGEQIVTEGGFWLKAELQKRITDFFCHAGHH